jgi:hypothetical protein
MNEKIWMKHSKSLLEDPSLLDSSVQMQSQEQFSFSYLTEQEGSSPDLEQELSLAEMGETIRVERRIQEDCEQSLKDAEAKSVELQVIYFNLMLSGLSLLNLQSIQCFTLKYRVAKGSWWRN